MAAPVTHASASKSTRKLSKTKDFIVQGKVEEIKNLAKEVVKSKKNCNNILNLFQIAETKKGEQEEILLACIRAYHRIFSHYLQQNDLQMLLNEDEHSDTSQVKVRHWLRDRYNECSTQLLGWLSEGSESVQELSLCTLMKFVEAEAANPMDPRAKGISNIFEKVVSVLLSRNDNRLDLINRFQEYLEYDDIRYHYMRLLQRILKEQSMNDETSLTDELDTFYNNILSAILVTSIPEGNGKLSNFLLVDKSRKPGGVESNLKLQRELYSKVWLSFTQKKLSGTLYKRILVSLPDKVIPHLQDPLLLSDWLISLYDHGGAVSLMALNGLFVLINNYNLEYPAFYDKLYKIMGSEIFHAKYKARFFHLLDMFLRSLLLPTYTVAAFIKKLSRMALSAPPAGILLIIELVINLLIRHDTCRMLIHREEPCDLTTDPYIPDTKELKNCRAMDSSLWEIKTLQKHWFHRIAIHARKIEKPLPTVESSLDEFLELDYEQLVEQEIKKSKKTRAKEASGEIDVPINYLTPKGLLHWETESLNGLWVIQDA